MAEMIQTVNQTYADRERQIDAVATSIDSITHRLRQGAISDELAATKLRALADQLAEGTAAEQPTPITCGAWTVNTFPSRKREQRVNVVAFRGEGKARQVINVELTPEAVEQFDPDTFWNLRK